MQRKNNILKPLQKKAMAMIMAIAVIVIIATILMLSLSLTTLTTKNSADLYIYEQSKLLARAAGEYAQLQIGLSAPCSYSGESFHDTENDYYNIDIKVKYVYSNNLATCSSNLIHATIQQDKLYGAALIDVVVEVNDTTIISEPIRVFQRKLIEF